MSDGFGQIVYPVKDIAQAKTLFTTLLGVEPYMDSPYYVGFRVGGQEIGLDPNGERKGMTGPVAYTAVKDIKAGLQALVDAGATAHTDPQDVGGGRLIATVKDESGNILGLLQDA
ncbi:glyoxalase/bleomycin resistance/dioxygenase family protein [Dactylosporangium aurantiacum]|uniref:Glyoxalase/bleomycin resistance/dioxygenase family protein n=1 Tax=Dactylosporangium aurantiacum TaxID=35754 RepID=A0A9Q9IG37_9ACTN|nr:VOC family protein [Dactylosporangium aurantiacum]MDG6105477.1 glyoxalase/bleomycin resistance/dioxygenase family protein [Dactylosporangium aurantiacum]UWZ53988.1 glyoxalase/bleomycin resistance/dioxygenase family protein [Dactylosporangium aurantiacum]